MGRLKSNEWWAVKIPDYADIGILPWNIASTRSGAIKDFCDSYTPVLDWKQLYRKGYRCVRVTVKEQTNDR